LVWKIEYTQEAIKQIKKLSKKEKNLLTNKIEELAHFENPIIHPQVKFLVGALKGLFRLRVSKLRVIFKISKKDKAIFIISVLHRKNAYK